MKRQSFIVLIERSEYDVTVVGPYRIFRQAEGDAKAWTGGGQRAQVLPITSIEEARSKA